VQLKKTSEGEKMKKLFYGMILMLLVSVLVLSGCASTQTNTPATNDAGNQQAITPSNSNPTPKTYGLGDSFVAGDFTWKIINVSTATEIGQYYGETFMGEKANGVFVILDVEVENTGKSAQYLSDSLIKLVDDQDREFSASTVAAIYLKPEGSALMFEQINPGIIKKGKIVYDVPTGLKVANVKISSSLLTSESYTVKIDIP